ncbi:hypothetical protein [Mycobacterium sp.]|uniref:channel accessory protein ArfB n=1 Tax=Mycobacterium sp. TaxID=1785 RepID=UPI0025FCEC35|nr:hypothetical protein [Mycobacterium sp.]MBW0013421.1 hypothetical protein [Mycobacterium sp.]
MDFVIQWLWYLLAFVAGSAIAWVIAGVLNILLSDATALGDAAGPAVSEER